MTQLLRRLWYLLRRDRPGVDYHGAGRLPVHEQGEGVNLRVALVTRNLFNVLGVTPLLGRNIRADDDSVAAAPVIAINYELWQRRYGANPLGAWPRAHHSRAGGDDCRGDASWADPFIDPEGYSAYIDNAEAEFRQGWVY